MQTFKFNHCFFVDNISKKGPNFSSQGSLKEKDLRKKPRE